MRSQRRGPSPRAPRRAGASSRSSRGRSAGSSRRVDDDRGRALRDGEAERGPAEEHALDGGALGEQLHVPTEATRDAARDGKADARAAEEPRRGAIHLVKWIEDALAALFRDARASVGDDE